jgi:hypothetical protein
MTEERDLGRFVAPGSPEVGISWNGESLLADGEEVPADRVASWAEAGYIRWEGDAAEWFGRERLAGRLRRLDSAVPPAAYPPELPRSGGGVLWFVATVVVWWPLNFLVGVPATMASRILTSVIGLPARQALGIGMLAVSSALVLLLARLVARAVGLRHRLPGWLWLAPFVAATMAWVVLSPGYNISPETMVFALTQYLAVPLAGAFGIVWAKRDVAKAGGPRIAPRGYSTRATASRGPLILMFSGFLAMFLGCGWFFLAFGASMTDASTPSDAVKALTPWAPVAGFLLFLFAPVAIIAGAIRAWPRRGR